MRYIWRNLNLEPIPIIAIYIINNMFMYIYMSSKLEIFPTAIGIGIVDAIVIASAL